jgi:hypothetical protein
MGKSPTNVTLSGRLSFPNFDYAEAVKRNQKSQYPKADAADVAPDFNILLEQAALDKFTAHVLNEFLPFCLEQEKKGEKRNALGKAEVDRLTKFIKAGDFGAQPPYIPLKEVHEKTKELAPDAVASLKVVGNKGVSIEQRAIVNSEEEWLDPVAHEDQLTYPVIAPIGQTVHQMYGGCYVAATLNLYSFISGKLPGFSAGASVAVFKADGERFGGGKAVDEDEIFLDD